MDVIVFLVLGGALGAAAASVWFLMQRQPLIADLARVTAELDATRRAAAEQRQALEESHARLRSRGRIRAFGARSVAIAHPEGDEADRVVSLVSPGHG